MSDEEYDDCNEDLESEDEPIPIGASEDQVLHFISSFLPLQGFISNKNRQECNNVLSNETNKSIKVRLNISDLEIDKSDVLSTMLETSLSESSLQYDSIIVDARNLGAISFSNFESVNLKNYECDKHISSQLLTNTSITTAVLQLQWTYYHTQLLDLLLVSYFKSNYKSIIIEFSSDDSNMQYFDTQIISKVLQAFGRHLSAVITCNKLQIRNIPKIRMNSIANEICPLLNLFPLLEILSVTSEEDLSFLQQHHDDVDHHSEVRQWTTYLCIHPNLRYLQFHNISNHVLPIYLLTGSTPYGFLDTLSQIRWYVIPVGDNGTICDDEISITNNTQNKKYSLSTFEMLLISYLVLNNTYTEEIQFSPVLTSDSHSNLKQILEQEIQIHKSRNIVTIEYVDEVQCCVVRRDESGE
jgi:hypothetical protein